MTPDISGLTFNAPITLFADDEGNLKAVMNETHHISGDILFNHSQLEQIRTIVREELYAALRELKE